MRGMDDTELPVRVHAALALTEMVQQHPPGALLSGHAYSS